MNKLLELIRQRQNYFFILGLILYPFSGLIHYFRQILGNDAMYGVNLVFLVVNLILFCLILFSSNFLELLVNLLNSALRTTLCQFFLFACLTFEQVQRLGVICAFLIGIDLAMVFIGAFTSENILWSFVCRVIFIIFILYVRFRKSILNTTQLDRVGIPRTNEVTWSQIIDNLHLLIDSKFHQTKLHSSPTRVFINKIPAAAKFPFLSAKSAASAKRSMHTSPGAGPGGSAFRGFFKQLYELAFTAPTTAMGLATAASGAAGAALVVYQAERQLQQNERHHQANLALKHRELDIQERTKLRELDFKERTLALQEMAFALQEKKDHKEAIKMAELVYPSIDRLAEASTPTPTPEGRARVLPQSFLESMRNQQAAAASLPPAKTPSDSLSTSTDGINVPCASEYSVFKNIFITIRELVYFVSSLF